MRKHTLFTYIILLYYTQDNIYYIETETLEQYLIKGGSAAQWCPGVEPCLQAHKGFLIPDHVIQLHHSVLTSSWVITAFYFIFKKHYVYMYLRETRLLKRGPRSFEISMSPWLRHDIIRTSAWLFFKDLTTSCVLQLSHQAHHPQI